MALQINDPDPDMMKEGKGWLSFKWQLGIMKLFRCIMTRGKVSLPPGGGSGSMLFTEENWILDLTRLVLPKTPEYRLQVKNSATVGKVTVNFGTVAGFAADVTLDFYNSPPASFDVLDQGVNYIYVEVPMTYGSAGLWDAGQPSIVVTTTEQANSDAFFYIELNRVTRTDDAISIPSIPSAKGDIWLGRWGPESGGYIEAFGHVAT